MNKTNGGVEPWIQGQRDESKTRNFSPMKLPPDIDDSDDDEVPREITRENFGSTFTKFAPPNTAEKSAKNSPKNSSLKQSILIKNMSRE